MSTERTYGGHTLAMLKLDETQDWMPYEVRQVFRDLIAAAEECEKLRGQVVPIEHWKANVSERNQLRAENDRLKSALREIEDHHAETDEWRYIARRALKGDSNE